MDWLTFFSALIDSLAWPLTVFGAIVLLRRPIANLIPGLRRMKYRDLELEFEKKLEKLEAEADEAHLPKPPHVALPPPTEPIPHTFDEYLDRLAELSPRGAVTEAWRFVEGATRLAMERLEGPTRGSARSMYNYLRDHTDLDRGALSLYEDLRALRNRAAHADDFSIKSEGAREYGSLALRLAAALNNAQKVQI